MSMFTHYAPALSTDAQAPTLCNKQGVRDSITNILSLVDCLECQRLSSVRYYVPLSREAVNEIGCVWTTELATAQDLWANAGYPYAAVTSEAAANAILDRMMGWEF